MNHNILLTSVSYLYILIPFSLVMRLLSKVIIPSASLLAENSCNLYGNIVRFLLFGRNSRFTSAILAIMIPSI